VSNQVFHPVSLSVIRQALAWGGIPKPHHVSQVFLWKMPSGTVASTVQVHLDLTECLRAIGRDMYTRPEDLLKLREGIRDSFCDDIDLTELWCDLSNDEIIVRLHCRVERQ